MKKIVMGIVVLMLASTAAFSQGSTKNQLDSCLVRFNDCQTANRKFTDENKNLKTENATLKSEKDKAVKDADALKKENESLKTKVTDLEKKNKECSDNLARAGACANTLEAVAAEKDRLATENVNLRNQLASVPAAPADKYSYPISGILTGKRVDNNIIIADFVFTNNGSKTIASFDSVLKFYHQGKKIYEIALPNVRNASGAAIGRGESINFRAGLPVTDQNLVNAGIETIDLIVEVTKVQ